MYSKKRINAVEANIFSVGKNFCTPVVGITLFSFTPYWPLAVLALVLFYWDLVYRTKELDDLQSWPISGKIIAYLCPLQIAVASLIRLLGLEGYIPTSVVVLLGVSNIVVFACAQWEMREMGPFED